MFQITSTTARLGMALLASGALGACSESKPSANMAAVPTVVIDGLERMRCSLGQTWEGNTCTGKAKTFNFDQAQAAAKDLNSKGGAHGKTDWRVPTVRELASLRVCSTGFEGEKVDVGDGAQAISKYCKKGSDSPTLDAKYFPNSPDSGFGFWSSSPYVGVSGTAWAVYFLNGLVSNDSRSNGSYHVLLVRTSQ